MQKWILPSSFVAAMVVSFLLFAFMAKLISNPGRTTVENGPDMLPAVLFEPAPKQAPLPDKPHKLPEYKKPTPTPEQPKVDIQDTINDPAPPLTPIGYHPTAIGSGTGEFTVGTGSDTILAKPGQKISDGNAAPLIQVEPMYPPAAARQGIEGWVTLSFDVDTDGSVINIRVVDSQPARVFNKSARNALKRWRYKAKYIAGEAVVQHGLSVQLQFTLED